MFTRRHWHSGNHFTTLTSNCESCNQFLNFTLNVLILTTHAKKERQGHHPSMGIGEQRPTVTLREFVESVAEHLKSEGKLSNSDVVFGTNPILFRAITKHVKWPCATLAHNPPPTFMRILLGPPHAQHLIQTHGRLIKMWCSECRTGFRPGSGPCSFSSASHWPHLPLLPSWPLTAGSTPLKMASPILPPAQRLPRNRNFTNAIYNYSSDAARYFDPSPENIDERMHIRKEGIELLCNLHNTGGYNRIIIVGHSLGGVIVYDLANFYGANIIKPSNPVKPPMPWG